MKHKWVYLQKIYNLKNIFAIKWVVLPIFFLSVWLSLSLIFNSDNSFTILLSSHNANKENIFLNKRLLKGQVVSGVFTATENHLGIIAVKFEKMKTVDYLDEDTLVFRIKEMGNNQWIYENTYRSGLAKADRYIPFGFLPINKSKDKIYIFELESLNGNDKNALTLGSDNPIYLTKYQFPKNEIFKNGRSIVEFFTKKISTLLGNYDLVLSSLLFLLPFIFYITWISLGNRYVVYYVSKVLKNKKYKKWTEDVCAQIYRPDRDITHRITEGILYIPFITILMICYIAFLKISVPAISVGLIGLWVIAIYKLRLNSTLSYILAFLFILISILSIYGNWVIHVDSASSLAYFLLVIGILQDVLEVNGTAKKS